MQMSSTGISKLKFPFPFGVMGAAKHTPTFVETATTDIKYEVSSLLEANHFGIVRISGIYRLCYFKFPEDMRVSVRESYVATTLKKKGFQPYIIENTNDLSVQFDEQLRIIDFYIGNTWVLDIELDDEDKCKYYFEDTISLPDKIRFKNELEINLNNYLSNITES